MTTSLAKTIDRSRAEKESWHYTNLDALLAKKATPANSDAPASITHTRPKLNGSGFVFINGVLDAAHSKPGDLPPGLLQGDAATGYAMTLAGQTCMVTSPVELLFVTTADAPAEIATRLTITLGANGRLSLLERHQNENSQAVHLLDLNIHLQEQSKLVHGKLMIGGSSSAHIARTTVSIDSGAFYDNFALIRGGKVTRNEIEATLAGKLAQCALNGAMLLAQRDHADTTTRIIHAAAHGTSHEVYKTVLADKSTGVFQGKIIVAKDAQKTDGYQLSRALLLSDQAEMDAKPELQIDADDVKCSHGSTMGELDDDALFYLRSRGLPDAAARALLIEAFVAEIMDDIHVQEWRDLCRSELEGYLREQR
jgi:Fe-S cluster assembly protein SufD